VTDSRVHPVDQGSATRWLNDLELRAWRCYVETQSDLMAAIEADLTPTGLTLGDYQVLVFLSEAEHRRMRMTDLADLLQHRPSGLTRRLDNLVKRGFVCREGSPHDRRVMLAVLTDDGWESLVAAAPIHVESVRRRLVDQLDDNELEMLVRIFQKVSRGLDN
jgi:DNA-binding MarR family transcriptional regulator